MKVVSVVIADLSLRKTKVTNEFRAGRLIAQKKVVGNEKVHSIENSWNLLLLLYIVP